MTLIITHVSQRRIFQSGDFRLTDYRTGALIDYWAQKQIIVQRQKWNALVGFCGIAHTGKEYVPDWIVARLDELALDAPFEDLVSQLSSAEAWLARANHRYRALTFSVGAFVETKPTFVLISNYEAIGRPPQPLDTFPSALVSTQFHPKKRQLFLAGRPNAVSDTDRARLRAVFRRRIEPEQGYAALADVNARAATLDTTVGSACFTSHATALGAFGGTVHGWPKDQNYLPAFIHQNGIRLPRLRPALDEQGKPMPIQMVGISGATARSSEAHHRIALEEQREDPSVQSSYGDWLRDHDKLGEAEAAYRKAIALDVEFAAAHCGLALSLNDQGKLDEAEVAYRRAVEIEPQSQIYLSSLALFLWWDREAIDEAEMLLHMAVAVERTGYVVARLAWFHERARGDAAAAAECYAEALSITPNDSWTLRRAAVFTYEVQGDHAKAREYFDRAVAGDSPAEDSLVAYSSFEALSGNYGVAAKLAKRALRQGRNRPDALAALAVARSCEGADERKVELMYREVLELAPGYLTVLVNLAQILLRRGGARDEALELLRSAAGHPGLTDEIRMEMLFFRYAYRLDDDDDAVNEIAQLSKRGVRVTGWDLSADAERAVELGREQKEVATVMDRVLGVGAP
jgi:tetratricopeptide (TPR) repeat protein